MAARGQGFAAELGDAVTPCAAMPVFAVLLLHLGCRPGRDGGTAPA